MSITTRKPEFRLQLGYPEVILTRDGETEPIGSAAPGTERFGADLRRLAAEVLRAGGRLTVVLPASEVWRGQVEPGGRAPRAEWRAARARAAAALGVEADALRTVVGRPSAGLVPAAAVRRSTLAEVRTLLASVGLRPSAIVGAGAFEGFAAPPRLGARWTAPPVGRRRALAGVGGLAFAAIALMVMAIRPEGASVVEAPAAVAPAVVAVATVPAAPPVPTAAIPEAAAPAKAVVTAPAPLRIARADPPPHRPQVPLVPAGATDQAIATIGTRNVPMVFVERKGEPVAELRLAELTDPRGPLTDIDVPLRRPVETVAAPAAVEPGPVPGLRPVPRPGKAVAAKSPAAAPAVARVAVAGGSGSRPMPRPEAEPVRVAALGNQVSDAVIAAAVLTPITPLARPAAVRTAAPRPAAVPVALASPKPVAAKPVAAKPVAPKPVAAKPVATKTVAAAPRVVAPAPKVVAVAPKPAAKPVVKAAPQPTAQRVVRVEQKRPAPAQPLRVVAVPAKAKPTAAPMRVAMAAPAQTVRRQGVAAGFASRVTRRDDLALIGIFGGSEGRKALIKMPNGKIRKVAAGDTIQGVQIAAIGSDSVRVSDGRRESVLQMPD